MYLKKYLSEKEKKLDKSHAYYSLSRQKITVTVCEIGKICNPEEAQEKSWDYFKYVATSGDVKCIDCVENAKKILKDNNV